METRSPSAEQPPVSHGTPADLSPSAPPQRVRRDDLTAERYVYEPHRIGLPPLRPYMRELWRRRQFVLELARTNLRTQHFNTVLGQLWLVVNPLLLAFVYFTLVTIVRGGSRGSEFLAHLMLGLFAFRFVRSAIRQGARSVVGGGRLILNMAFPRALLPLASVLTAFMRFLPTLVIYAVMHAIAGLPVGPHLLWSLAILALLVVFASGTAMLVAAAQVYFRDLRNLLTYVLRIMLFTSPILYYAHEVPEQLEPVVAANPLYPMLASLSEIVNQGQNPSPGYLAWGLAWAVGAFVVGALFFVSREREFAVRL
jgi:ABC-type polysaccharide/polyol phosphate export permease